MHNTNAAFAAMWLLKLLLLLTVLSSCCLAQGDYFKSRSYIHPGRPGPWIRSTKGQVWPKPHSLKLNGNRFSVVDATKFEFKVRQLKARLQYNIV